MLRDEMNLQVDRELAVIPSGDLDQNVFRMHFTTLRRNSLGPKPTLECSAPAVYDTTVAMVRRDRVRPPGVDTPVAAPAKALIVAVVAVVDAGSAAQRSVGLRLPVETGEHLDTRPRPRRAV